MRAKHFYFFTSSFLVLSVCLSFTTIASLDILNDSKKSHALEGIEAHTGDYTFSQRRYYGQCNGDEFWEWDRMEYNLSISETHISYRKTYSSSTSKIIRFEETNDLLIFYCATQYGGGINVYALSKDKNLLNEYDVSYGDLSEYKK